MIFRNSEVIFLGNNEHLFPVQNAEIKLIALHSQAYEFHSEFGVIFFWPNKFLTDDTSTGKEMVSEALLPTAEFVITFTPWKA